MKECCKKYLDEQFGGDADVVADIYGEYGISLRAKVAEAAAALAAGDWKTLDGTAHTIKGNALAVGDGEVSGVAVLLRQAAKLEDRGACAPLVSDLEKALETL